MAVRFYHFYYFITSIAAVIFPVWFYLKTRKLVSFGVMFPFFYIIYSFIAPVAVIYPMGMEQYTRAFYVWNKIFPLYDQPYIYTAHTYFLVFYVTWIIAFIFVVRSKVHKSNDVPIFNKNRFAKIIHFSVSTKVVLFLSFILASIFYWMIYSKYGSALAQGLSVYAAKGTREEIYKMGSVMKGIFSLWGSSLVSAAILVVFRYKNKACSVIFVYALAGSFFLFLVAGLIIGDRNQLIIPLFGLVVVYSMLWKPIHISKKMIFISTSFLIFNFVIKSFRNHNIFEISKELLIHPEGIFSNMILSVFLSVETFAAYTAMPFLISDGTPFIYGESFLELLTSFLPRFIAPFRSVVTLPYAFYAKAAGFWGSSQGFCMHHVSDWYFNFGVIGPILGGLLTGYAMGKVEKKSFLLMSPFWMAAFAMLCGAIPSLLRSPIPGIRSVFYEFWSIPFLLFVVLPSFKTAFGKKPKNLSYRMHSIIPVMKNENR